MNFQIEFLKRFILRNNCSAVGVYTDKIEGFILPPCDLKTLYFVCKTSFQFFSKERGLAISNSLIAAEKIEIEARRIHLQGTEERPLELVGLEGIYLEALAIRLENVVCYVLPGKKVQCEGLCTLINVRVVEIHESWGVIMEKDVAAL